jgi:hypothetical protein
VSRLLGVQTLSWNPIRVTFREGQGRQPRSLSKGVAKVGGHKPIFRKKATTEKLSHADPLLSDIQVEAKIDHRFDSQVCMNP